MKGGTSDDRQSPGLPQDVLPALPTRLADAQDRSRQVHPKSVEAYSTEDVRNLFSAATQEETELFQFLLCSGVREQEAMHASWREVRSAIEAGHMPTPDWIVPRTA